MSDELFIGVGCCDMPTKTTGRRVVHVELPAAAETGIKPLQNEAHQRQTIA